MVGDSVISIWLSLSCFIRHHDCASCHFINVSIVMGIFFSFGKLFTKFWAFIVLLEKLWIEADDLKDPVVQCKYERPRCRPQEVHLLVLEKVSILEKCLPRATVEVAGTPGSPTTLNGSSECQDSPSYSGNSSVVVQLSGTSSRRTSVCSSDGIAPCLLYTSPSPRDS